MNEKKVQELTKKSVEDLLELLGTEPSFELFAALHRLCMRYSIEFNQKNAASFFFRISLFDESKLNPQYEDHFKILKSVIAHARLFGTYNYNISQKLLADKFEKDEGIITFLYFLSSSGSTRVQELQNKLGTLSGFQRIIERCLDNKLIHVYESDVLPDLVSITYKGRRVLTHLKEK